MSAPATGVAMELKTEVIAKTVASAVVFALPTSNWIWLGKRTARTAA
jgi:hypothetical protein